MKLPRVAGFSFSAVKCGIKESGALDLGLIYAADGAVSAGVYTRNEVRAAPVVVCEERTRTGIASAVLVNSGNANACTGRAGHRATVSTTAALAGLLGTASHAVLPASTGVIGVPLSGDKIVASLPALVQGLSEDCAADFAQAILTTDQGPKVSHTRVRLGAGRVATIMAIAKGAGMIHPNMATTLGFVLTDAAVSRAHLRRILKRAADRTFNRISVDGDTSTNDTLLALASGALGGAPVPVRGALSDRFERALTGTLEDVAKMIVSDGEGAQHLVKIEVVGAESVRAATAVARTIATSQLVKTAIHGCDPNWGRILGAAGRAGVPVDSDVMTVHVGGVCVFRRGRPLAVDKEASAAMKQPEYTVRVRLGSGEAASHYWTCDLGHEYVRINAEYRT